MAPYFDLHLNVFVTSAIVYDVFASFASLTNVILAQKHKVKASYDLIFLFPDLV